MMLADFQWNTQTITVLAVFAVPISAIVVNAWQKVEKARAENELKRNMIQRGMSAEEIERVISAKTPSNER